MRRALFLLLLLSGCPGDALPSNPTHGEIDDGGCTVWLYQSRERPIVDPLASARDYCNWMTCLVDDDSDDPRRCPAFRKEDCHTMAATGNWHATVHCRWRREVQMPSPEDIRKRFMQ